MHHFLTAAGLLAVVGFAFGANAARIVAQIALVTTGMFFGALVIAVCAGYFE